MTRDQGAATGQQPYEPGRCGCGCLEAFHEITPAGKRAKCSNSACGCRRYAVEGGDDQ